MLQRPLPDPVTFRYATAIVYEPGVTRRDPSPVLLANGRYHVWYSKATVDPSGYHASVWHATSPDGHAWAEQDEAIPKGPDDAWDANGVFTPSTLVAAGRYYLYYTAVPKPFTNDNGGPGGTPAAIGVAVADSPDGPWRKFEGNPILRPSEDPADFDSHRVDDSCLIVRDGRIWLYYKGRQQQRTPGQTKMGVALGDAPTGPFARHACNPVVDSGHEVCVWPCGRGVAALMAPTGPQGSTIQFAPDGLSFEKQTNVEPPAAPGPYRADHYRDGVSMDLTWGISHSTAGVDRPYLVRFDGELRAAK